LVSTKVRVEKIRRLQLPIQVRPMIMCRAFGIRRYLVKESSSLLGLVEASLLLAARLFGFLGCAITSGMALTLLPYGKRM
jgi:hypothetical protein